MAARPPSPASSSCAKRARTAENADQLVESKGLSDEKQENVLVSVIMPMKNAEAWIVESVKSVISQTYRPLELSIYDDRSTDKSTEVLESLRPELEKANVQLVLTVSDSEDKDPSHAGAGYGRNRAISVSHGEFLCFLDADDVMVPDRINEQICLARRDHNSIVGCNFYRLPENSTQRYTDWCNRLTDAELMTHRFKELTVILPTWFTHRSNIARCGGFECLLAEDLRLFYRHIALGGTLAKVHKTLLMYRYHAGQVSHIQGRDMLFKIRTEAFQAQILDPSSRFFDPRWTNFSIWGAGRDGKKFFKLLTDANKRRVVCFGEVDPKKIGTKYADFMVPEAQRVYVPIRHWSSLSLPFVTCVAMDRENSEFEANLATLSAQEVRDYYLFG